MENKITISESQLREIVSESIKRVLSEQTDESIGGFFNRTFNGKNVRLKASQLQQTITKYQKLFKQSAANMNEREKQTFNDYLAKLQNYQKQIANGEKVLDVDINFKTGELDRILSRVKRNQDTKFNAEWEKQQQAADAARRAASTPKPNNTKGQIYTNPETGQQFSW